MKLEDFDQKFEQLDLKQSEAEEFKTRLETVLDAPEKIQEMT